MLAIIVEKTNIKSKLKKSYNYNVLVTDYFVIYSINNL